MTVKALKATSTPHIKSMSMQKANNRISMKPLSQTTFDISNLHLPNSSNRALTESKIKEESDEEEDRWLEPVVD